ncbi:hypothetical protein IGI04_012986 [Brassica rapa subsp. trilocularis]|uniref:Uncharacterized protein n=1 Tax=Brassica rapa subsp. trilocularis TaxID=1813537 RepID=A0ABQ7N7J7_BRACM|nr:hypothetical protein IGI04_012986 [Brassica rapa subsp. trilocularis]
MALQKHVKVQIITCLVIFTICLCLEFCSRWKHKDLKRRRAFGMIQFIWGFGAYETFEFLRRTSSNVSCTPLGRMTITSTYGIVWSSAVWSLSHMAVTIPYVVFPFKWLQVELQLEVSKRKVKVVHSPQTGLGRIFIAIICWFDIACESSNLWECSNSAFQHVGEGATYFPIFSTLPSSSTKFSRVVWAITRSVGRELICGVMINIFRSTQHHLPKKNARQILFDYVTGCTFHVGWVLIHSVLVSYESLELRGEKNCSCPSERRVPAKGYFWIIAVEDKAFHRGCAIVDGKLQLVQAKKGVWVAYLYGSRTLFVIIEVKIFSFVRPPWSFLALESVYSHSHLLPFISSFHCGLLKRELDVVLLVNLEFVVVNLTASSAHMDVVDWITRAVGNGETTYFWSYNWSPFGKLTAFLKDEPASRTGIPSTSTLTELWEIDHWVLPPARSEKQVRLYSYLLTLTIAEASDSYLWNFAGNRAERTLLLLAWQATIYALWSERNSRLHRHLFRSSHSLTVDIDQTVRRRIASIRHDAPQLSSDMLCTGAKLVRREGVHMHP